MAFKAETMREDYSWKGSTDIILGLVELGPIFN